jgi:hypothetical protein
MRRFYKSFNRSGKWIKVCKKIWWNHQTFLNIAEELAATASGTAAATVPALTRELLQKGRFSTVDLLIKIACFVKTKSIFTIKRSWSELVYTRRSTVMILPLQWGFPALAHAVTLAAKTKCWYFLTTVLSNLMSGKYPLHLCSRWLNSIRL